MSYKDLSADADPQALKARADLARVASSYGVALSQEGDRLVAQCPFHDDTRPSFDIWITDDGVQRFGCWACGQQGDVFTFLQLAEGLSFGQSVGHLRVLLAEGLPEGPAFTPQPVVAVDLPMVLRGAEAATGGVSELCLARGIDVPAEWLVNEYGLRCRQDGAVLIPHYSVTGELLGIKRAASRKAGCHSPSVGRSCRRCTARGATSAGSR